ncbi:MAG TPA: methyl-accepting chemotaxis protein [Phycisphaerales bacterium]|nr:methyl-accepting chemotaxis protein [Phycisphaerales bacterium]HMP38672.1 methyl-accepting chemotaxis protein [Phycisphaerales bacterium]
MRLAQLDTIAGRLLLLGVIPSILTVAALVALGSSESWQRSRRAAESMMRTEARAAALGFDDRAEQWGFAARASAEAQRAGLFGRREESLRYLFEILEPAIDRIEGTWLVYEPDADGNDRAALAAGDLPPGALDASGRFLPYYYVEDRAAGRIGLKPNDGMEEGEWYAGVRRAFERSGTPRVLITEPYLYEGVQMVSYTHPLVVGGRFAGVAGVDRSVENISAAVAGVSSEYGADVFVISRKGLFVATSLKLDVSGAAGKLVGKPLAETVFAPIAQRWLDSRDGAVFEAVDPALREACVYAVAKAEIAGWTIVLREPRARVLADAMSSLRRNVLLGGGAIVAVAGLLFLASRRITTRLRLALAGAERIAQGDLTGRSASVRGRDETATLLRTMDTMVGNLNGLVGAVRSATVTLGSTAAEMAASARAQQASASTFGSASNQIAAAVTEISATGSELVGTMDGVSAEAVETAELAAAGRTGLQGMEAVMRDLDRATGSVGEKLATINERSQKITSVITTITKVAEQTNILSINAAIEAEKAGEHGSGFLVIAREIRRLADQTAAATVEVESMVRQMQAAVSGGVMEMDRFSDQVRRGVQAVEAAAAGLAEIIDRVNRSTERFRQVNEGMQAQSAGADQIREAMGHLTGNATQAMQSIEQFGHAANDLQNAIATLRDAVARFTLGEE